MFSLQGNRGDRGPRGLDGRAGPQVETYISHTPLSVCFTVFFSLLLSLFSIFISVTVSLSFFTVCRYLTLSVTVFLSSSFYAYFFIKSLIHFSLYKPFSCSSKTTSTIIKKLKFTPDCFALCTISVKYLGRKQCRLYERVFSQQQTFIKFCSLLKMLLL